MAAEFVFGGVASAGVVESRLKEIELMLGPVQFDVVTDRSVQGTLRVAKEDFEVLERGSD